MKVFALTTTLTLSLMLGLGFTSLNAQTSSPGGGQGNYAPQQQRSAPDISSKDKQKFKKVRKDVRKLNQKFDKKLNNVDPSNQKKVREVYSKHQEKLQEKVKSSGLSVEKYNHLVKQQRSAQGGAPGAQGQ